MSNNSNKYVSEIIILNNNEQNVNFVAKQKRVHLFIYVLNDCLSSKPE